MRSDFSDDDVPLEQLTKDRPLNPFRAPKSQRAWDVVADVLKQVQTYERIRGLRQRQRRPADQQTFEATIAAVVCDLMHRAITCPEGWVSISLSNQHLGRAGRYRAPAMNKALPNILERLSAPEMAFMVMEKGFQSPFAPSRRTVLKAGYRLLSRIQDHGVRVDDLTRIDSQEVIVLKREKADFWDDGGAMEYEDTAITRQYRGEVEAINQWLAGADIQFDLSVLSDDNQVVDDTDRHMRRYFTKGSLRIPTRSGHPFRFDSGH
jgi:hypothetical protein